MPSDAVETPNHLGDLRALTDASLTHLDVDDLLAELLTRVREILDADTAAVLLLDESSGTLIARAARGIEAEVRQGVRVPLGAGFAGRIAAESRARLLVLTHFSQRYDAEDSQRLAGEAASVFGGQVVLARDLSRIPVPARLPGG